MEQTDLRTPALSAFADHMNRFIASDRVPSAAERHEMLTGAAPALYGPVVCSRMFQDVIEVLHRSVLAVLL
jgi:hypothetical protein